MKQDIKERWVAALRSGDYEQVRGNLSLLGCYCCLGVLCEVVKDEIELETDYEEDFKKTYYGEARLSDYLPHEVAIYAATGTNSPQVVYAGSNRELQVLNDEFLLSFNQIADLIEAQL